MRIVSWIIYIPLQIAFIPLAIVGVALTAYKQLVVSKRLGISQTAIEILQGRWTLHVFAMRDDEATARLTSVLPNASPFGLWLTLFPLWLKSRVAGRPALYPRYVEPGSETLVDLVPARTQYFDKIISRVIQDVQQFVLLGAGYDTRAYGQFSSGTIRLFEVDQASVQNHKLSGLEMAGIDHSDVTFVTVDFNAEAVSEKLIEAGYDPEKKTLFLWEGVTLYLKESQVRAAIADIRHHAASGSVLLADVYSDTFMEKIGGQKRLVESVLEATDELLHFGLDFSRDHESVLAEFVNSVSLGKGETYFMGSETKAGAYMAVAELLIE